MVCYVSQKSETPRTPVPGWGRGERTRLRTTRIKNLGGRTDVSNRGEKERHGLAGHVHFVDHILSEIRRAPNVIVAHDCRSGCCCLPLYVVALRRHDRKRGAGARTGRKRRTARERRWTCACGRNFVGGWRRLSGSGSAAESGFHGTAANRTVREIAFSNTADQNDGGGGKKQPNGRVAQLLLLTQQRSCYRR